MVLEFIFEEEKKVQKSKRKKTWVWANLEAIEDVGTRFLDSIKNDK